MFFEADDAPMGDPASDECARYFDIAKVYTEPHKGFLIQIYNNATFGLVRGAEPAMLSVVRFFARAAPRREYLDVLKRIVQENEMHFKALFADARPSVAAGELRKLVVLL